ncbi:hypothetical protein BDV38DRAFT_278617 [Aspergillus pseudotamarii]|uniref:NACHT domain-containing protein n=1 Tax=Aspergillus pseudotamarii TaxID=132259 RepID=A0A5N6T675_ASPPS|nr:uncharacterized protein BDV38DRAFT_278617 [Aspergillus pseudotamarii]KAE8141834.1 hypothetical protein BDV38DRAFT_278617 [Aspergillus pseudotamarii]
MGCFGLRKLVRKKPPLQNNYYPADTVVRSWAPATPPAQEEKPITEEILKVVDDSPGKEILTRDESLWNRAYKQLDRGLVNKFEELLAKQREEINDHSQNEINEKRETNRHEDLDIIIKNGLEHTQDQRTGIQESFSEAADWILSVKVFVREAVKASPEAPLAWAGVCILLPLLTNPHSVTEANKSGFTYVTGRIPYYVELERILWSASSQNADHPALNEQFNANLVKLYHHILQFQVTSVLRFHGSWKQNFVGDILEAENWSGMVSSIKRLERIVQQYAAVISNEVSRQHLNQVEENTRHNFESLQKLLPLAQRYLEVDIQGPNIQRQRYEKVLSDDERQCRQLFCLASNDMDTSYESYKSGVPDRLEGTGEWLLEQPHLHQWLQDDKGLLIVSADSGCGKSVLAKHLIDNVLPQSNSSATVCYFFFKDQVQNTQKQALCALLHQLFTSNPALIKLAMKSFSDNGDNLVNVLPALWDIFARVLEDPHIGRTVFVLDALDECKESELTGLTQKIKSIQDNAETSARFLLTSRPYDKIMSEFHELIDQSPHIHIAGENESEKIGQEVDIVIKHRLGLLAQNKGLNTTVQSHLEDQLLQMNHRTYLWIHLVFDYLERHSFRKVKNGIDDVFILSDQLPKSVNDAYAKILNKSEDIDMARKAFGVVLAARRPLTLTEMNVALHLDLERDELELESDENFQISLRNWCGILLSVNDEKVFFLHQTAREFLMQDSGFGLNSELGSIDMKEAQRALAVSCVTYMNKFMPRVDQTHSGDSTSINVNRAFSKYSANNWHYHVKAARLNDDERLEPYLARICDPKSDVYASWSEITLVEKPPAHKRDECNTLWMAANFGITSVLKRILQHEEFKTWRIVGLAARLQTQLYVLTKSTSTAPAVTKGS